jgi:hypothetical protein
VKKNILFTLHLFFSAIVRFLVISLSIDLKKKFKISTNNETNKDFMVLEDCEYHILRTRKK